MHISCDDNVRQFRFVGLLSHGYVECLLLLLLFSMLLWSIVWINEFVGALIRPRNFENVCNTPNTPQKFKSEVVKAKWIGRAASKRRAQSQPAGQLVCHVGWKLANNAIWLVGVWFVCVCVYACMLVLWLFVWS